MCLCCAVLVCVCVCASCCVCVCGGDVPGDLQVGSWPFAEQDVELGVLLIRGAQVMDAGRYRCEARSSAGTSSDTVTLEVGGEGGGSPSLAHTLSH